MTHEELEEAVPLYAAGALERPERQALETHLLSGCVSCHTALKEYQAVAAVLPFGLQSTPPPRTLKAKIMAARTAPVMEDAATEQQASRPSLEPGEWMNHLFPPESSTSIWSLRWGLGIAALGLLVAGASLAWNSYTAMTDSTAKLQALQTASQEQAAKLASIQQQIREREQTIDRLKAETDQQRTEAMALKEQLIQRDAELEDLRLQLVTRSSPPQAAHAPEAELAALLHQSTAVRTISLNGSEKAKGAAGFLLYDARTHKLWLYSINLPTCPKGMHYQIWAMQEKPVSMGSFHNHGGETAHRFITHHPNLSTVKRFTISLEPSGERSAPTGPIYLTSQS